MNLAKSPLAKKTIMLADGKERVLRYSLRAMQNIKQKTGISVFSKDLKEKLEALDETKFTFVLAEGLRHKYEGGDPDITEEALGELIDSSQVMDLVLTFMQAFSGKSINNEDAEVLAPFVPTSENLIREALAVADPQPGELLYDLGCGDGRVLRIAAKEFGMRAIGIERDAGRADQCREMIVREGIGGQVYIRHGNARAANLAEAGIIWLYLLQQSNEELRGLLEAQLPIGARVVSHQFSMQPWQAWRSGGQNGAFWIYKFGEHGVPVPEKNVPPKSLSNGSPALPMTSSSELSGPQPSPIST